MLLQSELDQCGCIRSVLWYNALISTSHLALTLNRLVAAPVIKLIIFNLYFCSSLNFFLYLVMFPLFKSRLVQLLRCNSDSGSGPVSGKV